MARSHLNICPNFFTTNLLPLEFIHNLIKPNNSVLNSLVLHEPLKLDRVLILFRLEDDNITFIDGTFDLLMDVVLFFVRWIGFFHLFEEDVIVSDFSVLLIVVDYYVFVVALAWGWLGVGFLLLVRYVHWTSRHWSTHGSHRTSWTSHSTTILIHSTTISIHSSHRSIRTHPHIRIIRRLIHPLQQNEFLPDQSKHPLLKFLFLLINWSSISRISTTFGIHIIVIVIWSTRGNLHPRPCGSPIVFSLFLNTWSLQHLLKEPRLLIQTIDHGVRVRVNHSISERSLQSIDLLRSQTTLIYSQFWENILKDLRCQQNCHQ